MASVTIVLHQCFRWIYIFSIFIGAVQGMECAKRGTTNYRKSEYFDCPTSDDEPDELYCCGTATQSSDQYCCNKEKHKTDSHLFSSTVISGRVLTIVALLGLTLIIVAVSYCFKVCVWYRWRQRRLAVSQPAVPVPSRDADGNPLYPTQQYYPVAEGEQAYPPKQLCENVPLAAPPQQYSSGYPMQPISNGPDLRSSQPFTYGPAIRTQPEEYK